MVARVLPDHEEQLISREACSFFTITYKLKELPLCARFPKLKVKPYIFARQDCEVMVNQNKSHGDTGDDYPGIAIGNEAHVGEVLSKLDYKISREGLRALNLAWKNDMSDFEQTTWIGPPSKAVLPLPQKIPKVTCKRAGVKWIRVHDLRRTYASPYVMNGGSLSDLQSLLGHSTSQMTQNLEWKSNVISFAGMLSEGRCQCKTLTFSLTP